MSSRPEPRRRLASRVVWGATLSGALAGALAAGTAILAVDRLIAERADRRLHGAADILAGELDESFREDEWEPLAEILEDENSELVTSGIRLGVFTGGHRIGGEVFVPSVAADSCQTRGGVGGRVRACGRAYNDWVLVAAAEADDRGLPMIYLLAGLGALLAGAGVSALASRAFTRWALAPLTQLTAAVATLQPERAQRSGLGPASDVEEVELIRAALTGLLARTTELLSHAQRFAADAAHELRTPLTTIRAELELLIEEPATQSTERLQRVSRRARQLAELVERLLVLASPLDTPARGETIALSETIEEVVADLPPEQRARIRLALHGEGLVRGDSALLRSLVANGLENALKFSGEEAPVDVRLDDPSNDSGASDPLDSHDPHDAHGAHDPHDAQDGHDVAVQPTVRLEIRDRGPGVPHHVRGRVFEPFFRSRPDATPGHGLGLTLIGHIARTHGGAAEFVDVPGDSDGGACLRVSLPAWRP